MIFLKNIVANNRIGTEGTNFGMCIHSAQLYRQDYTHIAIFFAHWANFDAHFFSKSIPSIHIEVIHVTETFVYTDIHFAYNDVRTQTQKSCMWICIPKNMHIVYTGACTCVYMVLLFIH